MDSGTSRSTAASGTLPEPIARMDDQQREALAWHLGRQRVTLQDSANFLGLALRNINALIQEAQFMETMLTSGSMTAATEKRPKKGQGGRGSNPAAPGGK